MTNKLDWLRINQENCASMLVILTTFAGILLSRVLTQPLWIRLNPFVGYLLEFTLIILPCVLVVSVASDYCAHVLLLLTLASLCLILCWGGMSQSKQKEFNMDSRSIVLTICRALTFLITAICILAVDFESFYKPYRKSRFYGAALMDTGIGLFVAVMGLVSRRTQSWTHFQRILTRSVCPLLVLGFVRVLAVKYVGYHQDVHEYGVHLNAFFTIGLTKFLGSLFSLLPDNDAQLAPVALVLLVLHQSMLSFGGISDYVMDDSLPRSNVLVANREGISAMLGFVVIYLLCMLMGKWFMCKQTISYADMLQQLRRRLLLAVLNWLLTGISGYFIGISRVCCNLGYVLWVLAITNTIIVLNLFVFELLVNSLLPLDAKDEPLVSQEVAPVKTKETKCTNEVFIICEALNLNGLTFFLLANLLTGFVNIYMQPESYSDLTSVSILLVYMFINSFVAYKLYMNRIRIA